MLIEHDVMNSQTDSPISMIAGHVVITIANSCRCSCVDTMNVHGVHLCHSACPLVPRGGPCLNLIVRIGNRAS